jgi:hypothetical protein
MRLQRLYDLQDAGKIEIVPFFYSATFPAATLDAGVTSAVSIPIQSDSHFLCRYLTGEVYDDASPVVPVAADDIVALVNLFDTGSGRTLMDNPVPWQSIIGTGQLPYVLAEPWLIRAGGQVQVTLQNIGTDDYDLTKVVLSGMKIYQFGSQLPPDLRNL